MKKLVISILQPLDNPIINDKFWKIFESNVLMMLGWGWLKRIQKVFMPACFIYLNLLICSYKVTITGLKCFLVRFAICFFLFLCLFYTPSYNMLLAFSAIINFNVKLSSSKFCYSYTDFDAPSMYKIAEVKNLSLMQGSCRYIVGVGGKISHGHFISRIRKSPARHRVP